MRLASSRVPFSRSLLAVAVRAMPRRGGRGCWCWCCRCRAPPPPPPPAATTVIVHASSVARQDATPPPPPPPPGQWYHHPSNYECVYTLNCQLGAHATATALCLYSLARLHELREISLRLIWLSGVSSERERGAGSTLYLTPFDLLKFGGRKVRGSI